MLSRGLDQRIFSREEIAPQGAIKLESRRRWENPLQENRCETLLKKEVSWECFQMWMAWRL